VNRCGGVGQEDAREGVGIRFGHFCVRRAEGHDAFRRRCGALLVRAWISGEENWGKRVFTKSSFWKDQVGVVDVVEAGDNAASEF